MKFKAMIPIITAFLWCTNTLANTVINTETYEKNGIKYIVKSYEVAPDEDITTGLIGDEFELNGVLYKQTDLKTEPMSETLTKEVSETKTVELSASDKNKAIELLGERLDYSDDEGYTGELVLDRESVTVEPSGYSAKSYTKTETRYYFNLPNADLSNIPKTITSGGITLNLYDTKWTSGTNSEAGDTAVANTFTAKAYYSGSYSVKTPSSYKGTGTFKGTAAKEVSDKSLIKITYKGERITLETATATEEPDKKEFQIPVLMILIGDGLLIIVGVAAAYLLIRKRKENAINHYETEEDNEEL